MIYFTWLATAGGGTAVDPDKAGRLFSEILPWLILLTGLVIAGGVAIYFFKRWMDQAAQSDSVGFSLQDLREMHQRGELTNEQYEAAKLTMIGRLAAPDRTKPATGDAESNRPRHE